MINNLLLLISLHEHAHEGLFYANHTLLLSFLDHHQSITFISNPRLSIPDPSPLTFYMLDSLTEPRPLSSPVTTKVLKGQLPFPKPLGLFPPAGGIPLPDPDPNLSTQTLDLPGIGISFSGKATLEELEFGMVTVIDETLFEGTLGVVQGGKTHGIYVASLDDGSSHMMAMTASFMSGEYKDGLRLFGVHRTDVSESQIAVIGGTRKYHNANGYATIMTVNLGSTNLKKESEGAYKTLKFDVFLG